MNAIKGVLRSSPQIQEVIIVADQPEYIPLPVAVVHYANDQTGLISCYKLTFFERLVLLFHGLLWIEQLTAGRLQPQRPTVFEPLTEADNAYSKRIERQLKQQQQGV